MNILKNPHFIFDVHVHEVVDASLSVIAQTFMDACTRTEHKLSRVSGPAAAWRGQEGPQGAEPTGEQGPCWHVPGVLSGVWICAFGAGAQKAGAG